MLIAKAGGTWCSKAPVDGPLGECEFLTCYFVSSIHALPFQLTFFVFKVLEAEAAVDVFILRL